MASSTTTANPDMPVQIKITVTGKEETRKFKLTLKDLGANVLPEKLRSLLLIPKDNETVFERYSDSSSSFVKLDSSNPSIYKQLLRAAKAKGKLRLRVTVQQSIPAEGAEASMATPSQLPSHRYVYPYVTEATQQDLTVTNDEHAPMEEPKAAKSPRSNIHDLCTPLKAERDGKSTETAQGSKEYTWPVTDSSAWSERTKTMFDRASRQSTQESLRKIKEVIAARATNIKTEETEAPVPRYFSARDHCREEQNAATRQGRAARGHGDAFKTCTSFTICCNNCDLAIPDAHWHCSICDEGDFDLCEACVNQGFACDNDQHWLIKRTVEKGKVVNSTTETLPPKTFAKVDVEKEVPGAFSKTESEQDNVASSRTCNSCVQVFDESQFVTCDVCEDYDLCIPCHVAQKHGHHPSHALAPATAHTMLTSVATALLTPGRNIHHWAVCDGCSQDIYGVRHKCLKCPDWDYCSECIIDAQIKHPGHRFAALYEPIANQCQSNQRHDGIFCDGPLCRGKTTYIRGDRYKCAVCHDTDFCANCEALPRLPHNRTHPLLKFKTPVRNVSVSTYGGKQDGSPMMAMGDQIPPQTSSKATETQAPAPSANAATQVHTVAEVDPLSNSNTPIAAPEITEALKRSDSIKPADLAAELNAHFVRDLVTDGTSLVADSTFTQTWTLRNPGPHNWPAGCSVCFIGGDGMFDVDPDQPSHILHIRKTMRSNAIDHELAQGKEADFTVVLRAPTREGNAISYWRLKGPDGAPFGHKLWCDIVVQKADDLSKKQILVQNINDENTSGKAESNQSESQLIFPKLDKESPAASTSEHIFPSIPQSEADNLHEDVESLKLEDGAVSSDDGFLTDEEYDLIESGDEFEEARNGKK